MSTNRTTTNPSATVTSIRPALQTVLARRKDRPVPFPELKEAVITFESESRVGIPVHEPNDGHSSVNTRIIAEN